MEALQAQAKIIIDFLRDHGVAIRQAEGGAWIPLGKALRVCKFRNPDADVDVLARMTVRKMLIGGELISATPLHELLTQIAPCSEVSLVRNAGTALLEGLVAAEHPDGSIFMPPDAVRAFMAYISRFLQTFPEWEDDIVERPGEEPLMSIQLGVAIGTYMLQQVPCPGDPEAIRRCVKAASESIRANGWSFSPRSERRR